MGLVVRLLAALFLAGCAGLAASAAAAAPVTARLTAGPPAAGVTAETGTAHNWLGDAWTTHDLQQSYPSTASYFFNRSSSYGVGSSLITDPVRDGFATTPVLRYTSYAKFSSDVSNGLIPASAWTAGSWVEYDLEAWAQTPVAEQQHPAKYLQAFGSVAHAHGLKVIMTPARDLGKSDTECPIQSGEKLDHWYIRCGIPWQACAHGDGLVVQTQSHTTDISAYDSLFRAAKNQVASHGESCFIDAELTDAYGTPSQAYAAGSSVTAAGYFIICANSDIWWENSLLTKFKNNGY